MNFVKESESVEFFFFFGWGGGGVGGGGSNIYFMYFTESLKSKSGHLSIDPKQYGKYQNPSSSSSQDIMLTRFFYCYNARVIKGA